jgi:CRP/FNR family transcriptional regulator, cyclic AMP receptor protein
VPSDSSTPNASKLTELLGRGRWFRELPPELQHRILAASRIRDLARGEVIALQGAQPAALSVVLAGAVKLVRQARQGDEALLYICEPGFWFGEYGVLTGESILVTAIAKMKTRLLILPKSEIDSIVTDQPLYFRHFAMLAIGRTSAYLKAYIHATSLEPEARLRGQLYVLSQMKMDELGARPPVELPYSQSELASLIGVSRQTVNQLMRSLVAKGFVEASFKNVRVLAPQELLAGL